MVEVLVERSSETRDASEDAGEDIVGKPILVGVPALLVAVGRGDEVDVGVAF